MKIPSRIQVGGHFYDIVPVEAMSDNAPVTHRLQKILINMEGASSRRVEGLVHELLHVVNSVYNSGRLDEDSVDSISEGFYQVLLQFIPNLNDTEWEVLSDISKETKRGNKERRS